MGAVTKRTPAREAMPRWSEVPDETGPDLAWPGAVAGRPGVSPVMALTAAAAGTDAVSFLGLGHVFSANMTGNTVLLGLGVATGDLAAASRSATALGAFLVMAGCVGAAAPTAGWSRRLHAVLAAEFLLLAALTGWWAALPGTPTGAARYGLVALAGAAMGAQSAAARRLRIPSVTTTYITGTWTTLSETIGAWLTRRRPAAGRGTGRQVAVVAVYPIAALAASTAYTLWRPYALLVPTLLLGVTVIVLRGSGRRRSAGDPGPTGPPDPGR